MLSARAAENGAYVVVANKCGTEAGIARYAGRSTVWGPDGTLLAQAGAEEPETLYVEIDPARARGLQDRSPEGYPAIVRPRDRLPIAQVLASSPSLRPLRVAIVNRNAPERAAQELEADVTVGPGVGSGAVAEVAGDLVRTRPLSPGAVVDLAGIGFGYLRDGQGLVPEEVRVLMLEGATVVLWEAGAVSPR